jgi:hypothetical protein
MKKDKIKKKENIRSKNRLLNRWKWKRLYLKLFLAYILVWQMI